MSILKTEMLTKRYGSRRTAVTALDHVELSLEKGEILGVAGESGSGKTTLLKLISGLEAPSEGSVLLQGKKLNLRRTKEEYRTMQMIFQDPVASFHPRRTIADSIEETVKSLCGKGGGPDPAELYASVGLSEELAGRLPRQLSGGQCQRFAIARAMAVRPSILLCDEITSALDVSTQARILKLFKKICRENDMSVIFVSHDLAVLSCLCDRILILKQGRVAEEGKTRQIIDAPREEYTRRLIDSVLDIGQ